jgi:hypothetical protein
MEGLVFAVEEAVMVTPRVLLPLRTPTEQVTPARELEGVHVYATNPEKLLIAVKVRVDVPLPPGAIVTMVGEALKEKSPGAVVKLNTLDHGPF